MDISITKICLDKSKNQAAGPLLPWTGATTARGGPGPSSSAIPLLPFPSDRRPGIVRGRGGLVLVRVCFRPRFFRFCGSSLGVMVGQMLMVLLGGVTDAGERLVESKLLEWLRSGVAS
jgi:hypothetical protein